MRIFLSYGSQDRETARELAAALRGCSHRVFFGGTDLAPGEEFHSKILERMQTSDAAVFLLGPSVADVGRYLLAEVELAERRWPDPVNRVFPIIVRPIDRALIPGYLRAVTIDQPEGPVVAAVVHAIQRLKKRRIMSWVIPTVAIGLLILIASFATLMDADAAAGTPSLATLAVPGVECSNVVIDVTANSAKPSGDAWDVGGGKPDISIAANGKYAGPCDNSLRCTRTIAMERASEFALQVWDNDIKNHDRIVPETVVAIPSVQKIGSADVTISCER